MFLESPQPVDMRTGLIQLKQQISVTWENFGEGVVLFAGLPASGKDTMVELLYSTGIGGLLEKNLLDADGEIPFKFGQRLGHPRGKLEKLYSGIYPAEYHGRLYIAGILGSSRLQQLFAGDERLIVVGLDCNLITRMANFIPRVKINYEEGLKGSPFQRSVYTANSIFSNLFVNYQEEVAASKPDLVINISIGSRLSLEQARQVLFSA